MYRISMFACVALLFLSIPTAITAQDEDTPGPFIYGTYSVCDLADQSKLGDIVESAHAKVYGQAMKDGAISGWGYMAHHTGGNWRRIVYHSAPTLAGVMTGADAIFEGLREDHGQAQTEYSRICPRHDDYVWEHVTGSDNDPIRAREGNAAFSVYFICDENEEERADELMAGPLAAAYNKQVKEGNITSWGWFQHWIGGKYRRLSTMTGKDHATVLKARDAIIADQLEKQAEAMEELTNICGSHADYMWDVEMSQP